MALAVKLISAVKIGVISYEEGQRRLLDLERELNRVYMDVYEESKQHRER